MASFKDSHVNPNSQKVASSNHPADSSANDRNAFRLVTHDNCKFVSKREKGIWGIWGSSSELTI
jgi:hypothetical protein